MTRTTFEQHVDDQLYKLLGDCRGTELIMATMYTPYGRRTTKYAYQCRSIEWRSFNHAFNCYLPLSKLYAKLYKLYSNVLFALTRTETKTKTVERHDCNDLDSAKLTAETST